MPRPDLVPDCGSCAAICCVVMSFETSEHFAFDKPAGTPCPHLGGDHRCRIHHALPERGFAGCAAFDCHGAGQRVTRTFPDARVHAEAFMRVRLLHELLWLLTEAAKLCRDPHLREALDAHAATLDALTTPEALLQADLHTHRKQVRALLRSLRPALRVVA